MTLTSFGMMPHHHGPSLGDLIVRFIKRYGDRVALVFGDDTVTYAQLVAEISRISQALMSIGVRHGDGICLLSPNTPQAVFVRLAAHLMGFRYTALNPLGQADDHAFMLRDSEARVLIVAHEFAQCAEALREGASVEILLGIGTADIGQDLMALAAAFPAAPIASQASANDIARISYTGGTTGRPKGVVHRHSAMVMNILMCFAEWDWPTRARMLLATPLSHAAGTLLMPIFVKGGTAWIEPAFDPAKFVDIVEREAINATFLVPTMIHALVEHPAVSRERLHSLDLAIYGAAPITLELLREARERIGPAFMQLYAQSEAPMTVTTLSKEDHKADDPAVLSSCGYPMVGVQVALLGERGEPVASGEPGELCVRGPLVMEGYWRREEETAAALAGGWLHTGDIAREDETGRLHIVGRKKDMIISGGFNIFPKEIEDALAAHPAVAAAAVFGVPDPRWGEEVRAVVIAKAGVVVSEAVLKAHVRSRKGAYQTPKSIRFAEVLPLTALGKPDRNALRELFG